MRPFNPGTWADPGMPEQDCVVDVSKTANLQDAIYDKTPGIVTALMTEVQSVVAHTRSAGAIEAPSQ